MSDTGDKASREGDHGTLTRFARWMVPAAESGSALSTWLETVIFSAATVIVGRHFSPDDPLFAQSQFPWPWFAPALLALRYGVMPGIASSGLLLAGWYLFQADPAVAEVPKLYFLGGLLLVMVCGEYSGLWRTRLRRMVEVNYYLEDRIERVTKRLYLMRLSHERLEQDMLSRPSTLRDAVGALRRRVAGDGGGELPGAQDLLAFLAQYCQLEVAAIYVPDHVTEAGDFSAYHRVADIGAPPPLRHDDPLLAHARERRHLAHIQVTELDKAHPTEHLVVAPIETGRGRLVGMLVVTRMPFFAMNEEMLQMISVMLSAYADGITAAGDVVPLLAALPGLPVVFAEEYIKLARLQRDFSIASHIVVLVCFGHPARKDIFAQLRRERRQPDIVWAIEELVECSLIVTLMPLAGTAAVDGYLMRVEGSLRETHGEGFRELGVYSHVIPLSQDDPLGAVRRIMTGKNLRHA